jgi:tripartite ATP-independent transporter DctP family solute receptor
MMLKKSRCLVLATLLILVFVSVTSFAAVKPIKLVYGSTFNNDHFCYKGDLYFKKLVEKNSKGQIVVDYFGQCQLGSITEQVQATKTNAQQMFVGAIGTFEPYLPKLRTFGLPYVYRNKDHVIKVANKFTSLIDNNEFADKTGTRILGFPYLNPSRKLHTKFPVNKIEDIKGLKIRVPQIPSWQYLWRSLDAIIVVLPITDTYTALATGTADAHENTLDVSYTNKFFEQTKYCAFTNHIYELGVMIINNQSWNSLTAAQKRVVSKAAEKASEYKINAALKSDMEYKKLLKKEGMKFSTPDLTSFKEKAKPILDQYGDKELLKKIENIK